MKTEGNASRTASKFKNHLRESLEYLKKRRNIVNTAMEMKEQMARQLQLSSIKFYSECQSLHDLSNHCNECQELRYLQNEASKAQSALPCIKLTNTCSKTQVYSAPSQLLWLPLGVDKSEYSKSERGPTSRMRNMRETNIIKKRALL